MSQNEEAAERLVSDAIGAIVFVVEQDGSTFCRSKEPGLVVPLVSANGGNVLTPKEIISTIKTVDRLIAKSKTTRKTKKVKRIRADIPPDETTQ